MKVRILIILSHFFYEANVRDNVLKQVKLRKKIANMACHTFLHSSLTSYKACVGRSATISDTGIVAGTK